jgi:ribosomal protein L9
MKILLLQPVRGLGKERDIVEVNDARAFNELLPKRLALIVTPSVLKRFDGLYRDLTAPAAEAPTRECECSEPLTQEQIALNPDNPLCDRCAYLAYKC